MCFQESGSKISVSASVWNVGITDNELLKVRSVDTRNKGYVKLGTSSYTFL